MSDMSLPSSVRVSSFAGCLQCRRPPQQVINHRLGLCLKLAEESLNLSRTGLGDSDFRVLEVLLHKGPLPVNTIGPKVWLTPGSISVAVDRLEKTALVKRKNTEDRRGRPGELTPKRRALITKTLLEHPAAREKGARGPSKKKRVVVVRL